MADAIVQTLGATGPTIYASKSLQNGDELTVDTSSTTTTTMDASGYLYTTSLYDLIKLNVSRPSTGELFTYDVFVRPFGTDVKPFYKFNWMILSAAAAEFTPLQLFSNGEQGAWYDPSDLPTLYQDSAGTTPVTADGDPVGLMLDKSGNGNHAPQSVSADRPQHRADGTLRRLAFDGVDDILLAPLGDITTPYIISYSLNPLDLTRVIRMFAGGTSSGSRILTTVNTDGSISIDARPEIVTLTSSTGLVSTNTHYVLTFSRNSAEASIRLNGQVVATGPGAPDGTLTSSTGGEWGVGAQYYTGAAGAFSKCELNGLVIRHGADYTETQVHDLESYLAAKAGVTL